MDMEIDEACVEGLAAKLRGLDLSEAEGVLLDQIVRRAMIAGDEVEGFGYRPSGSLSDAGKGIAAAAGLLGPGHTVVPKPYSVECDDMWVR